MKKILIVEDDLNMHSLYDDIFSGSSDKYLIEFSENVEEAIERINRTEFDLVILDIIMKPLSGKYLFLKLRDDKSLSNNNIPIIVTSVLEDGELEVLTRYDNTYLVHKPFGPDTLLSKIEEVT